MRHTLTATDGRTLIIRSPEGKDAKAVLDYLDKVSAETDFLGFGLGERTITEEEEVEYLEKARTAENMFYALALIEGNIAGILSFEAGKRPRQRHAGSFGISVLQEYWGLGVASALLDALIDWAKTGGIIKKINLTVRVDNKRAIALYRRKGFGIEGTQRKEMYVNGIYYDDYTMGLIIGD